METKHTATPWKITASTSGCVIRTEVEIRKNQRVSSDCSMADAEFIVRACNVHQDLVDELARALPFLEDMQDDFAYKNGAAAARIKAIRAALAKATGE